MATLEERINSAKIKVEKLSNKLTRYEKKLEEAAAHNFGENYYSRNSYEQDIRGAKEDFAKAKKYLQKLEDKKAEDEANSIRRAKIVRIPVIEEFLDNYRRESFKFENENFKKSLNFVTEWEKEKHRILKDVVFYSNEVLKKAHHSYDDFRKEMAKLASNEVTEYFGRFGYNDENWNEFITDLIEKDVEDKRNIFYDRVSEKAGNIIDAHLYIGGNGEINGWVEGDKSNVSVETITAGGWNIQCRHFRVLVRNWVSNEHKI
jgi:DNA repair exonuclease SbcCD ATPase subunit